MKIAICNEIFKGWSTHKVFHFVSETGYDGIEIAPFVYENNVNNINNKTRMEIRKIAKDYGLNIVGLHWVFVGPKGLSITSPDKSVRDASRDYVLSLIDFCGDIGGKVIVFGSPKQRNLTKKTSYDEGIKYASEVFGDCLNSANSRDVILCIEPLASNETNFINTVEEASFLIKRINHPNFKMIIDVKAVLKETREQKIEIIIKEYKNLIEHFHVNDVSGTGPGLGDTNFSTIINALRTIQYKKYISVEVFDYNAGTAEYIARESIRYLRKYLI